MSESVAAKHFLYFADPMCSWCYGFSPVMTGLAAEFSDRLPVRVVVGGLRAGNTRAMRAEDKDYIRNAWTRVGEATGQPFDHRFFDRDGFVYDTEPACRAVVAVRRLAPDRALGMLTALSRAFYADGRDTTDVAVLADIAAEQGHDRAAIEAELLAPDVRNETFRDFLFSQQSGVTGFPCLVVGNEDEGYALVANGYRPAVGLTTAVERWLGKQAA